MRKIAFLVFFMLPVVFCFTNDGYYDITGDTLHPITSSNVSMDYERLRISYNHERNEYDISAYIELFNHDDTPVRPLVGFELDQGSPFLKNEEDFKDYVLLVNDEPQSFELEVTYEDGLSPYAYALLYRPEFTPGLNRVYHEYTLDGGRGSLEGLCVYVLTTGARWKDGIIKNFEIIVETSGPGILRTGARGFSDFDIVGEGKIYAGSFFKSRGYEAERYGRTFSVNTGYLYKRITDFHPVQNIALYFFPFHYWGYRYSFRDDSSYQLYRPLQSFYEEDMEIPFPTHKFIYYWKRSLDSFKDDIAENDDEEYTYKLYEESLAGMDKQQLRILRNTLYALRGYVFNDGELQEYFDEQYWYYPDATQKPEDIIFDETSKEILQKIIDAENTPVTVLQDDAETGQNNSVEYDTPEKDVSPDITWMIGILFVVMGVGILVFIIKGGEKTFSEPEKK
jgi:hypothetical protein